MTTLRDIKNWFRIFRGDERIVSDAAQSTSSLEVELYTRPGCSLCTVAKDVILRVRKDIPFIFREVDISGDPDLEERFGTDIPVVFVCGRRAFKYRVDESRLRKSLRSR